MANNTDILLELGTNELEIMEFKIGDNYFGINVAKVVEIMKYVEITPMANSNPYVEGIFKPRNEIITVIDLASYMGLPQNTDNERDILIITYFNNLISAFHVHSVEAIHRISWENIEKPNETINGGEEGLATGIARLDNKLITIVDFEKILVDISPGVGIQLSEIDSLGERGHVDKPIIVAEDSPLLQRMILSALDKAGYKHVLSFNNGKDAWKKLLEYKESETPIEQHIGCIITDIEMPQMDGHHLLKNIRDNDFSKALPVLIFSSLIDDAMKEKGVELGVSGQINKPEIGKLIQLLDQHIVK
jgi:two-component system, chemotaxis family, chemotaxis protein CheV